MNPIRYRSLMAVLVATAAATLVACGGPSTNLAPGVDKENPAELIQKLEKDVAGARRDQVDLLAPTGFAAAELALTSAREQLAGGNDLLDVYAQIDRCRIELISARDKAELSRLTLAAVIKQRELARAAGAADFADDYTRVENQFLELTRAIEKGHAASAQKRRDRVAAAYDLLELRAIKHRTLGEARKLLAEADRLKTDRIAPKTYQLARKRLDEADAYITANRYKTTEMQQKADEAVFQVRRHLSVAEQCQAISDMVPEAVVLDFESRLHDIAVRLAAPDMRDHIFDVQVENLLGTIDALQYERSTVKTRIGDLQTETANLRTRVSELEGRNSDEVAARERLAAEKRFNEQIETVRTYFEPHQADIYKAQGRLVIRLKTMHFPVGRSDILPENQALLGNVRRAIGAFDSVDLIIEGHTDSTGSEDVNERLSEQRADAVRHYLVANETLPYDRIIALGYGSSRPLVSNSTAKGRAINRRIDLIITPHVQ
jgi:OOP family OmpA-OmpF porin